MTQAPPAEALLSRLSANSIIYIDTGVSMRAEGLFEASAYRATADQTSQVNYDVNAAAQSLLSQTSSLYRRASKRRHFSSGAYTGSQPHSCLNSSYHRDTLFLPICLSKQADCIPQSLRTLR